MSGNIVDPKVVYKILNDAAYKASTNRGARLNRAEQEAFLAAVSAEQLGPDAYAFIKLYNRYGGVIPPHAQNEFTIDFNLRHSQSPAARVEVAQETDYAIHGTGPASPRAMQQAQQNASAPYANATFTPPPVPQQQLPQQTAPIYPQQRPQYAPAYAAPQYPQQQYSAPPPPAYAQVPQQDPYANQYSSAYQYSSPYQDPYTYQPYAAQAYEAPRRSTRIGDFVRNNRSEIISALSGALAGYLGGRFIGARSRDQQMFTAGSQYRAANYDFSGYNPDYRNWNPRNNYNNCYWGYRV